MKLHQRNKASYFNSYFPLSPSLFFCYGHFPQVSRHASSIPSIEVHLYNVALLAVHVQSLVTNSRTPSLGSLSNLNLGVESTHVSHVPHATGHMVATPVQEHLHFVDCALTHSQVLNILLPSGLITLKRKGGS